MLDINIYGNNNNIIVIQDKNNPQVIVQPKEKIDEPKKKSIWDSIKSFFDGLISASNSVFKIMQSKNV